MDLGVSAYSGPGGSGGISVSAYRYSGSGVGGGGDWRIGVVPFSGHASGALAYRRILGLGVGGGRGVGVSAYYRFRGGQRRIGVSAYSGGRGSAYRRIGVLSFLGQPAYSGPGGRGVWGGDIGVSACWSGTSTYRRILGLEGGQGKDRRIGVSAYSGPEGSVGGGGAIGVTAYRRMLVFCPSLHARCIHQAVGF